MHQQWGKMREERKGNEQSNGDGTALMRKLEIEKASMTKAELMDIRKMG